MGAVVETDGKRVVLRVLTDDLDPRLRRRGEAVAGAGAIGVASSEGIRRCPDTNVIAHSDLMHRAIVRQRRRTDRLPTSAAGIGQCARMSLDDTSGLTEGGQLRNPV